MSMEDRYFISTTIEPQAGEESFQVFQELLRWLDSEHCPEVEKSGGSHVIAKIVQSTGPSDVDDIVVYVQEIPGGITGWEKYCREKRTELKLKFLDKWGAHIGKDFTMKTIASKGINLLL